MSGHGGRRPRQGTVWEGGYPLPPGVMGPGKGAVTPPRKIFGLLLLKWCILRRSERVDQQCTAHVIRPEGTRTAAAAF